jgi:uncharacterized membrane protein
MTSIPSYRAALASPRLLAAWALIGYVAVYLFLEFVRLLLPDVRFSDRAASADFRNLVVFAMPVVAVLLAHYVSPPLSGARLISLAALIEYGAALVFGSLTLLIGLPGVLRDIHRADSALNAIRYVVLGLLSLVLLAIAGFVTLRTVAPARTPAASN